MDKGEEIRLASIVGRNEPCICGSGKKFKKCCVDKWLLKGIHNYEDKPIIFDKNRIDINLKKLAAICLKIDENRNRFTLDRELNLLENIYSDIDDLMKAFDSYFSCKKGCSKCCNINVDATPIEAELIRSYILNNFGVLERRVLLDKLRENSKNAPILFDNLSSKEIDLMTMEYFQKDIPCPFLSPDKACLVYEVRPFSCRSFSVFSNPSNCGPFGKSLQYFNPIMTQVLKRLPDLSLNLTTGRVKGAHISHWFTNGFDSITQIKETF